MLKVTVEEELEATVEGLHADSPGTVSVGEGISCDAGW